LPDLLSWYSVGSIQEQRLNSDLSRLCSHHFLEIRLVKVINNIQKSTSKTRFKIFKSWWKRKKQTANITRNGWKNWF